MSPHRDSLPGPRTQALRLLLVEDSPTDALLVEQHLADVPGATFDVRLVTRLEDGCAALAESRFDCVLTDLGLPDAQGLEVIRLLDAVAPDVPIVVLSGHDDAELALRAVEEGAEDYVPKRFADTEMLGRAVRQTVQRRRTRVALAASERRRQAMLDTAHEAFIAVDDTGMTVEWNGAAERMFGWTAAEVLGRPLAELIMPPEVRQLFREDMGRMVAGATPQLMGQDVEVPAVRRDGTTFTGELTVTHLPLDDGLVFFGFLRDISDRKRADDAVRRSEELFRTLVSNLPATAVLLFDPELRVVEAEGSLIEDGTWPREGFLGRHVWDAIGVSADDFAPRMTAALQGERGSYEWECLGLRRVYWFQIVPVIDSGVVVAGLLVMHDVTERRRADRYSAVQHAVNEILAASPEVEHAIPMLLEAMATNLWSDVALLWEHDAAKDLLRVQSAWHRPGVPAERFLKTSRGLELPRGVGLPGQPWLTGKPAVWPGLPENTTFVRRHEAAELGLTMGIAVPVRSAGRFLGVLELFTGAMDSPEPDGLRVFTGLAGQIGDFLERKRVETDLAEHASHLATVGEATRTLSQISDPAAARQTIIEATRTVTGASGVLLAEPVSGDDRRLRLGAVAGLALPPDTDIELGTEPSVAALAFRTGERLFVPDVSASRFASQRLTELTGARSALAEPVMRDGKPVAVLGIMWDEPLDHVPPRLSSTIALLATEAGAAIERANLLAQLNDAARTDDLTSIPNRRRWDEELPRAASRARRTGEPLSLALLDIDYFKRFNDTHGHPAGDELLRRVAAAGAASVRETDIFARVGGEEFGVLLPACDLESAVVLAERVREAMPDGVTCSCGVATWDGREGVEELTRRADEALYRAKAQGRDRTVAAGADAVSP